MAKTQRLITLDSEINQWLAESIPNVSEFIQTLVIDWRKANSLHEKEQKEIEERNQKAKEQAEKDLEKVKAEWKEGVDYKEWYDKLPKTALSYQTDPRYFPYKAQWADKLRQQYGDFDVDKLLLYIKRKYEFIDLTNPKT